jgi:hypothetical protein
MGCAAMPKTQHDNKSIPKIALIGRPSRSISSDSFVYERDTLLNNIDREAGKSLSDEVLQRHQFQVD